MQVMDSLIKRHADVTNDLQEKLRVSMVKNTELRAQVQQQSYDLDGKDSKIMELNKQIRTLKRQRNWSIVTGIVGMSGIHLGWKYVRWRTMYGSKN